MKKTGDNSDTYQGIFSFLIQLSRIFGLAPVIWTSEGFLVSHALVVYSRILIIIMHIVIIGGLAIDLFVGPEFATRLISPVEGSLWIANICIVMVLMSDGVYNAPWRILSLIRMTKAINKIQLEVGARWDQHFTQKKIYIELISVLVTVIILLIVDFCEVYYSGINTNKEITALYFYVLFYAEYGIIMILEIQFVALTHMPYVGLQLMNYGLQDMLDEYSDQVDAALSCRSCSKIRKLTKHYLSMCKSVREINKSNSSTLFCIMILLLFESIVNSYYWVTSIVSYRDINVRVESSWCIFHFIKTVFLLEPIHKTQSEILRTHCLIRSIIHRAPMDTALKSELDNFVYHLMLNNASYTPMGIFTISTPFVIATVSGMASYIVLMVQLS